MIEVSIILGTYNRLSFLKKTIQSIREDVSSKKIEIIVIDGGSNDGTLNWLINQKDIISIVQHNRGKVDGKPIERKSWGYFMNLGFKASTGKFILMLSDDCLLVPSSISNSLLQFEKLHNEGRKIGAIAYYWRNWPEMSNYWVGVTFGKIFVNHGLYLREVLQEVEWINDKDYHFYYADGDLSLKIWEKGYEIVPAEKSFVEHYSHANLSVRASNLHKQNADNDKYKKLWENKKLRGQEYAVDWLFNDHVDKLETYKNFPFLHLKKQQFKLFLKKLIN